MFDRPEAVRSRPVSGIKCEALIKDTERGAPGGIAKLVYNKAGLGVHAGETWIRTVFQLLQDYEIVEKVNLPDGVRRHLGGRPALQVSKRVVKLVSADNGWRCRKCTIWRPYRADACYAATSCSGDEIGRAHV